MVGRETRASGEVCHGGVLGREMEMMRVPKMIFITSQPGLVENLNGGSVEIGRNGIERRSVQTRMHKPMTLSTITTYS